MTDSYLKFQFSLMAYLQLQYLQKFMILWLHTLSMIMKYFLYQLARVSGKYAAKFSLYYYGAVLS